MVILVQMLIPLTHGCGPIYVCIETLDVSTVVHAQLSPEKQIPLCSFSFGLCKVRTMSIIFFEQKNIVLQSPLQKGEC